MSGKREKRTHDLIDERHYLYVPLKYLAVIDLLALRSLQTVWCSKLVFIHIQLHYQLFTHFIYIPPRSGVARLVALSRFSKTTFAQKLV